MKQKKYGSSAQNILLNTDMFKIDPASAGFYFTQRLVSHNHVMLEKLPEYLTCATCVYATYPNDDGLIECRRFPPETWVMNDGSIIYTRPQLSPTNGCGEHTHVEDCD